MAPIMALDAHTGIEPIMKPYVQNMAAPARLTQRSLIIELMRSDITMIKDAE